MPESNLFIVLWCLLIKNFIDGDKMSKNAGKTPVLLDSKISKPTLETKFLSVFRDTLSELSWWFGKLKISLNISTGEKNENQTILFHYF